MVAGVPAGHAEPAGEGSAGEMGHQAVDGAQQRGFAGPGTADHQAQLALVDLQVDPGEDRARATRSSWKPTRSKRIMPHRPDGEDRSAAASASTKAAAVGTGGSVPVRAAVAVAAAAASPHPETSHSGHCHGSGR